MSEKEIQDENDNKIPEKTEFWTFVSSGWFVWIASTVLLVLGLIEAGHFVTGLFVGGALIGGEGVMKNVKR